MYTHMNPHTYSHTDKPAVHASSTKWRPFSCSANEETHANYRQGHSRMKKNALHKRRTEITYTIKFTLSLPLVYK